MDPNILLRKAEIRDIERIKVILFSSLKEYNIAIPDNYSVSDIDSIGLENNSDRIFILLRDSFVIGFIVLRPITKDCIELKRLYVAASERGHGLGAYLLNHAINFAKKNENITMRLETTSKFKKAVSLYKNFGFKILKGVETTPGHDLAFEKTI